MNFNKYIKDSRKKTGLTQEAAAYKISETKKMYIKI